MNVRFEKILIPVDFALNIEVAIDQAVVLMKLIIRFSIAACAIRISQERDWL